MALLQGRRAHSALAAALPSRSWRVARPMQPLASTRPAAPLAAYLSHLPQQRTFTASTPRSATSSPFTPPQPAGRRTSVRVAASWGAPIDYQPAKLVSREVVAEGLVKLVIDVGTTIAKGYTLPGQYVMLRLGEAKPGFFAIASTPASAASGTLELLIKQPAPDAPTLNVAALLTGLAPGAAVDVSPVQGKGFPVDRIPAQGFPTVLLFATGTGISPIKALIESGALGHRTDVRLFYGTRNPGSTAYSHLVDSWQKLGVAVTHVYSDEKQGYVQDAFAAATGGAGKLEDPAATGVVVCGHGDMCKAVTALLVSKGVAADKVLMNY